MIYHISKMMFQVVRNFKKIMWTFFLSSTKYAILATDVKSNVV